jgi:hypothetical protein
MPTIKPLKLNSISIEIELLESELDEVISKFDLAKKNHHEKSISNSHFDEISKAIPSKIEAFHCKK